MERKTTLVAATCCLVTLMMLAVLPAVAGQVVITGKGTVVKDSWDTLGVFQAGNSLEGKPFTLTMTFDAPPLVGHDDYGIFKIGRNLAGQDFILVFTFSDSAKRHSHMCGDQGDGTSYLGTANDVRAKAVLTIGGRSFVFGAQPDSEWGVFRGIS
jgi:hypothetical protein